MNKLLSRQFKKYLGQAKAFPPGFDQFIAAISESYDHFERDRKIIERSIEISSNEMIGLNIELRKEKEELGIIQEELNFLFNSINECLFSIDMHSHQLLRISAPCEKIYGYSPSDFLANPELWSEVIYPDDQRMVNKDLRDLYEGKPVRNQYRIVRKDNTVRWVENRIIPTINSAGELIRIDGVINDITDRKQIELDLERSVSVLEATLE